MSGGRYAHFTTYMLRHSAAMLYDHGQYERLFEHMPSREWFEVQTAYDPGRRTYADSLDWTLRAAELDLSRLPYLLPLTLLRPTVAELAARIPSAVLEVMARLDSGRRAESYAELHADPASRCETLCRVARARLKQGDLPAAQENLRRARQEAAAIVDPQAQIRVFCEIARCLGLCGDRDDARPLLRRAGDLLHTQAIAGDQQSHLAAGIALAAREVGDAQTLERALTQVRSGYQENDASVQGLVGRLGLRERDEYLLALAALERGRFQYRRKQDILTVAAQVAARLNDGAMLDRVLAELAAEMRYSWHAGDLEGAYQALIETGRADELLAFLAANTSSDGEEEVAHSEAAARAAGRLGDVALIERLASLEYTPDDRARPADDLGERVADFAGRVARRAGLRLAGVRDWGRVQVLLAGVEGLLEAHPEQARALWQQRQAEAGWLLRGLSPLLEGRLADLVGEDDETPQAPAGLQGLVSRAAALALRFDWNEDVAGALAVSGGLDDALAAARKHELPYERAQALSQIADALLEAGDVSRALEVADEIDLAHLRYGLVQRAADQLDAMPPDRASALLDAFAAEADHLPTTEQLTYTNAFDALARETARLVSVPAALDLVSPLGALAMTNALPALAEMAVARGDLDSARTLLARARAIDDGPIVGAQAQMAAHWASAAAGDTALAAPWTELAREAFRLSWSGTRRLKMPGLQQWILPWLARAARHLGDKKALRALQKLAQEITTYTPAADKALADQVYVQVALGLVAPAEIPDYEVVGLIWHREYQALARAERAGELLRMEPRKGIFGRGPSREDLEIGPDILLDSAIKDLSGQRSPPPGAGFFTAAPRLQLAPSRPRPQIQLPQRSKVQGRSPLAGLRPVEPPPDEHSVFGYPRVQQPQMPQFVQGFAPDAGDRAELDAAGRQAMGRVFAVLAQVGRQQAIVEIAGQARGAASGPYKAAAVQALVEAGHATQAREFLPQITVPEDRALALAALAVAAPGAEDLTLLEEAHQLAWETEVSTLPLVAVARAAERLPEAQRWRFLCDALGRGRQAGRDGALMALEAFAPLAADLVGPARWQETVRRLLEMEDWFS